MTVPMAPDFPVFDSSDFSGEATASYFDLIKLQDNPDIPRGFPHRHNYYHLLWMTEAEGTHMLDFESFPVRANTVFFVSPGATACLELDRQAKGLRHQFQHGVFCCWRRRSNLMMMESVDSQVVLATDVLCS